MQYIRGPLRIQHNGSTLPFSYHPRTLLNADNFGFQFSCGYTKPTTLLTLDDQEDLVRSIWLHFVLFQPHAELEQLWKGLYQTLRFELLVCSHPNEVWGVLAASTVFVVTPEYLCDSFVVQYSDNGSNNRTKEEAILWILWIWSCLKHIVTWSFYTSYWNHVIS